MYNLNDKPKGIRTLGKIQEKKESRAPCIYHRKELGGPIAKSKNPSRLPFTYSMRYFKIPRSSLSTPMSILLYTLERTARIVGSSRPPRMAIRGHRRLQPASKSGSSPSHSVSWISSSLFLRLARKKRRAKSTAKEKRNGVMYVPRYTMYVGSGREHRRSL